MKQGLHDQELTILLKYRLTLMFEGHLFSVAFDKVARAMINNERVVVLDQKYYQMLFNLGFTWLALSGATISLEHIVKIYLSAKIQKEIMRASIKYSSSG